ncbi:prion-like protein [Aphelenchoides avenae]|nr:prion-like protein [Aphelenchus avenae]
MLVSSVYTSVDKREEPLDRVDALLFWINKICMLVRDDVERSGVQLKGSEADATIPEMEDLYEDLCDGTCICALLAFYRPHDVHLQDVFFNERSSLPDCRFNLSILKNFCAECLPWNPFHFDIEDILYLHESFKPNVDAFLADLFNFFEFPPDAPSASTAVSPTQRRFVPIQGIPDLRAQNLASRPTHPPRVKNYTTSQRDRTMSLASMDSLMTTRTGDSLRYQSAQPSQLPPNAPTTTFGVMQGEPDYAEPVTTTDRPSRPEHKSSAQARLLMEERRREMERQKLMTSTMKEEERQKAGKDAFFKLMSKSANDGDLGAKNADGIAKDSYVGTGFARFQEQIDMLKMTNQVYGSTQQISHALSQPSIHNEMLYMGQQQAGVSPMKFNQYGTLPRGPQYDAGFASVHPAMDQSMQNGRVPFNGNVPGNFPYEQNHYAMPQGMLPGQIPYQLDGHGAAGGMYQPFSGAVGSPQQQMYQMQSSTSQPSALHLLHQQAHTPNRNSTYFPPTQLPYMPYGQQSAMGQDTTGAYGIYEHQQQPMYPPQAGGPPSGAMLSPPFNQNAQAFDEFSPGALPNANTFRLHQPNASSSRLDPPLELNRNLTNWGLTYRVADRPQRKTWTTVFKSETDVSGPTEQSQADVVNGESHPAANAGETPVAKLGNTNHQQSPPKDPDFRQSRQEEAKNFHTPVTARGSASGGLLLEDAIVTTPHITPEMEAKRQALLASQLKRKEKIIARNEEEEAESMQKRMAEQQKQELAEQRKLEQQLKRQKLLEDYKRKKIEQELGEPASGANSARGSGSSSSATTPNRGHSQPPFGRPKSQSNMHSIHARTLQRPGRTQSSVVDENAAPRIFVPSTAEPSLKLFAKAQPKSNRSLIMNALQYSIFPGAVSNEQRNKVQGSIAQSDSKHFLVLFRDHKCQYRGLYTWDQVSDTLHKIDGTGPKVCREDMISLMFKYDSGAKKFANIPTKHLSATIDGFTIQDQYWLKPKIPHSGGR